MKTVKAMQWGMRVDERSCVYGVLGVLGGRGGYKQGIGWADVIERRG